MSRPPEPTSVVNLGTARLEALYHSVTENTPPTSRSLHVKSILAMRNRRFTDAAELSAMALVMDPSSLDYNRQLGEVCGMAKWWEPAVRAFNHAIYIQPSDQQSWFFLGRVFERVGHVENAETCYTQCLSLDPTFDEARDALDRLLGL
jgi:Flp pilus assembly protein TadD